MKNQQYTDEEKIEYFSKRFDNPKLSKGQREYAAGRYFGMVTAVGYL